MKIVFKKDCDIETVQHLLYEFINREREDYPKLKGDMSVTITLKNDIGQINPNNGRKFIFNQKKINEYCASPYHDKVFEKNWTAFCKDNSDEISQKIENEKKKLVEERAKNKSISVIHRRENLIKRKMEELDTEKRRIEKLQPFIKMFEQERFEYRYIYDVYNGEVDKRAYFKLDGKEYYFAYFYGTMFEYTHPESRAICDEQGNYYIRQKCKPKMKSYLL